MSPGGGPCEMLPFAQRVSVEEANGDDTQDGFQPLQQSCNMNPSSKFSVFKCVLL